MQKEEYEVHTTDDDSYDEDEYYWGGEEEKQQSRISVNTADDLAYNLGNRINAVELRNRLNKLFQTREVDNFQLDIPHSQTEPLASEYIMNTSYGLLVMKPNHRACCICTRRIDRVIRYEPDAYYDCGAWYVVWFVLANNPLVIFDKEINQSNALRKRLEQFCNVRISIYKSAKKTNELLLSFLESDASIFQVPINYGWLYFDQAWQFVATDGKTHNSRIHMVGNLTLPLEERLIALSKLGSSSLEIKRMTLEKAAGIMRSILDPWTRKKLWLHLHVAAIYSFLKNQNINFPTGLYIETDSLKVRKFIEEIFTWYEDPALSLSDDRQVVQDQLVFYKDQPILMVDERCTRENEKLVQDVLSKSSVKVAKGKITAHYPLNALPVVLGNGSGGLINSERLNHLVIEKTELSDQPLETVRELKPAFYEYMMDFMKAVSDDKNFVQDIRRYVDCSFDLIPDGVGIHHDAVVTSGILIGIQEKLSEYYKKLYNGQFPQAVAEFAKPINQKDYLELYQQASNRVLANCDLHTEFISKAQSMIEHGDIKIKTKGTEKHFYLPIIRFGEPVVFKDEEYVYITGNAFEAICEACQCGRIRMSQKLAQEGLLYGCKINLGSKMTRLTIQTGFTSTEQIGVYMMDAWRFLMGADEDVAEDAPYKLLLGMDSHDRKRMWSGSINSHIRITGCSGTGKSYLLRYLAGQLPAQGVKCIILDSSGDFSNPRGRQPEGWPVEGTRIVNMREDPIELISFAPKDDEETIADIIGRISTTISVALGFGKRQIGHLTERISYGLQYGKLKEFKDLKELLNTHGRGSQSANSVYSAMDGLWDVFPTGAKSFDWEFDKAGITIINLHEAYGENAEKIVVEMLLGELSNKRMRNSMADMPPLVLIMDECQRLCWNENSFASKLMKESRKYGISIWAGTQSLGKKTISNALGQCGLQLAFMPDAEGVSSLSKELTDYNKALFSKCAMRLRSLKRGQFLYVKNGEIVVASAP